MFLAGSVYIKLWIAMLGICIGACIGRKFSLLLHVAALSFRLDSLTVETSLGEHCPVNEIYSQLATFHFFGPAWHSLISSVRVFLPDLDRCAYVLPSVI